MVQNQMVDRLRAKARTTAILIQAVILGTAMLLPFMASQASAGQLGTRSAVISTSKVSAAGGVQYSFTYTPSVTTFVQGIVYAFCTTPLGTCSVPTGMSNAATSATQVSQSGWGANATAFAPRTGADLGACVSTSLINNTACYTRATGTANTLTPVTHVIGAIPAPTSKQSVYVRISLYTDTSYATQTDAGTVAVAFVDQLLVSGRVQERLDFCVATITNAASVPTTVANCSAIGSTSMDIGVIDNSTFAISPVAAAGGNGADNKYGILMSDTNGSGGESISYFPEAAATGTNQLRNFRISGASCDADASSTSTVFTDGCFRPAAVAASGTTFTTGNERFGMNIPCIDTTNGTTVSLTVPAGSAGYNADGTTTTSANCQDPTTGDTSKKFAWDNSGTATTLASSTTVVDKEIVKIRFGATASAATASGNYSVTTTYIASPIF